MKILNYGSINIDTVFSVPCIVRPGETLASTGVSRFAGGKGANQSVALARAGAEVWQAGKIGPDGAWLLDKLSGYGVNTELVRQYSGPTGQAIIQVGGDAQNAIILLGGGNREITREEIDQTLSGFSKGDVLVAQNEINDTPYVMTAAKEKGLQICLNPAPFDAGVLSWPLDLVDILVVNEIEAEGLSGASGSPDAMLSALADRFPDTDILLTAGEAGAFYGRNGRRQHAAAVETKVVDTTAAGDTFLGYYLASAMGGLGVKASLERASKAASLAVSRKGAMDAIPLAREVD